MTEVRDCFGRMAGVARLRVGVGLRTLLRVSEVPCDEGTLLRQMLTRETLPLTEEHVRRMKTDELARRARATWLSCAAGGKETEEGVPDGLEEG